MATSRALFDLLERAGQLLREGTPLVYTKNLELELYATVRALEESEAEIEARPAPFPASLPPWLVMQWLSLREVPAALRVAWSWRLDSEHYFRVFAERHRSLASGAGCGSLYIKWENHAMCHMQMQRSGRLTEFQQQVFRYYCACFDENFDEQENTLIPIGEVIAAVREVVNDATAEQVKTAVANLVSLHRLEASITGAGHRVSLELYDLPRDSLELYDLPRDDNVTMIEMMSHIAFEWHVLTYHILHGTGDWGCKIHDVAASLGIDLAKVRLAVAFLSSEGHLYSTVDEDHHKYTE